MKTDRQTDEIRRLLRRCEQHEHALEQLTKAVMILRRGNDALRDENRELRVELQRTHRFSRAAQLAD